MPQVSASPIKRHAQQTALERLRRLSCAGLDVAGFLNQVNVIVGQLVPNGAASIESPFWFTLDPESQLVTSIYGQGCDLDPSEYMQWELLADDFIKTADVVRHPRGALTLHEVTDGRPERSTIYVEVMEPSGMAQELLVALRSQDGATWGTARLNRAPGDPMFSEHEINFMTAAAPLLAEGVRRGLLVGEANEPEQPGAPGLVVLSAGGDVVSLSPGATWWLERLPYDDGRRGEVPTCVRAVATSAAAQASRNGSATASMARVATTDGSWAILHGTRIEIDGTEAVTVMIEAADPRRIAPLLMSIYGLTEREQDVTGAVLRGGSTTDLARELGVSPHTVQVHLKRIFEKTGVNSRGELVAKIYFDCYDLRTRDNRARISEMKPIRGGPKPSAERRAREG